MWEWVLYHEWKPYYVTFMFHPLRGTPAGIIAQMHRGTRKGFYSRFCTEFAHHPRDTGEQKRLPRLMLFPDRPVCKRQNHSLREVSINDNGLHFQGPMIIPPESRFQGSVIDHIMENQPYAHHGIQRVYVKKVGINVFKVSDYAVKTIRWGRADPDDILILPLTPQELSSRPVILTGRFGTFNRGRTSPMK
jgi:hypothetical protein